MIQHSWPFRLRRLLNWLPMGFAYAFLYMGRYNLTVAASEMPEIPADAFGLIFGIGAIVYGCSFLVNGPLIDRYGGRWGMLIGVAGALAANVLMGLVLYGHVHWGLELPIVPTFILLYGMNMYFQSFGAVSIVKVKVPWFHVRERGTFSTIFGIIIASGIYFAFDWGGAVVAASRAEPQELGLVASFLGALFQLGNSGVDENWMVFFVPAIMMGVFWAILYLWLRDKPSEAGFNDFDTGEATLSDDGTRLPVRLAIKRILTHPVLLYVCLIEFCSGVMRNGIMHWYKFFGKAVGFWYDFLITDNWGLALLIAGVVGANATGWVSAHLFQSRRAPMSGISYGIMVVGVVVMVFTLGSSLWLPGIAALAITAGVVAVHGILSGTATSDFGGYHNTGVVVGIVDGFVYLGTGFQSIVIGLLVPTGDAAKEAGNWVAWPLFLLPFAIVGLLLTIRIWHALPSRAHGQPATEEE